MRIPQEKNIESKFPHIKKEAFCAFFYYSNPFHNWIVSIDNIWSIAFFSLHKEKWTVKPHKNECTLSPSWVTSLLVFPYVVSCILPMTSLLSLYLFMSYSSILQLFSHRFSLQHPKKHSNTVATCWHATALASQMTHKIWMKRISNCMILPFPSDFESGGATLEERLDQKVFPTSTVVCRCP